MAGGVFDVELVDERPGLAVLRVRGRGAAALFADEAGGHRWQRVPPTEKRGRVHTSTVTVAVLPEPKDPSVCRLDPRDLEITTMRGSGAGGQHRNKTDSAVRVRHLPSGLEVRCESERSQSQNKETALAVLRARLVDAASSASTAVRDDDRRRQVGSGMRGDKRRTVAVQRGVVVDEDGRIWRYRDYVRGVW